MLPFAFDAGRLDWPTDWDQLFGRTAPLFMEIGFGNGQFLVDLAQANPQANVIGIEISLPSIKKAERKVRNLGLDHVCIIHGDARAVLWGGCLPKTLDKLYINFPDPWHKAAHHHRKLINDRFLHLLATRMPRDSTLDIATDDPGYQDHITECLERTPYFASRDGRTYWTEDLERIRTKYELKALAEGRVCNYYHWRRNETAADNIFLTPQELDMPHAIIESPMTLAEIGQRYETQSYSEELPIRFLRSYTAADGRSLLIEAHVVEEPLPQRVALVVQERENPHSFLISLHEVGFPRPTYGLHRAIAHLARWLVSLSDQATVTHHNLSGGL